MDRRNAGIIYFRLYDAYIAAERLKLGHAYKT